MWGTVPFRRDPSAEKGSGEETWTLCKPAPPAAKAHKALQLRYHFKYSYFSHSDMRNINWPNFAVAVTILLAV